MVFMNTPEKNSLSYNMFDIDGDGKLVEGNPKKSS